MAYGMYDVSARPLEKFSHIYILFTKIYMIIIKSLCENDLFELVLLGYLVFPGLGCLSG